MNRFYLRKFRTYFDDPPAVPPPPPPPPAPPATFTQDQVNKMMAEHKKTLQKQNEELATQLQQIRDTANLSVQQKEELEARIQTLSQQHLTEAQKLQAQLETTNKKYKTDTDNLVNESKKWQGNFATLLIRNGVMAGASKHQAADATGDQLLMMLAPQAKVVQEVDEAGQPTDRFVAKLPITVIGKDKKPVVVELPIEEAIGELRKDPKNANLFLIDGKPGIGGSGNTKSGNSGETDWSKLTPAEHRARRAEARKQ